MNGSTASKAIFLAIWLAGCALAQSPRTASLQMPGVLSPHPAVVRIYVAEGKSQSIGSGTLIDVRDKYGLVVTNWHVIRDAIGEITVVFPDGFRSAARIVHYDKDWDLAALSIWRPQAAPVQVALEQPRPGELLTIAGYGSEGKYRAATGACTQYLAPSDKHPYELVELATPARKGDSGGPIFNARGELAGVLFGSVKGTTTGSYGGRVWKFVEPLLQPNAEITAPDPPAVLKSPPVPFVSTTSPATAAETNVVSSTPSSTPSPARSAAPLEPVVLDANQASSAETPSLMIHTPFPYREDSTGFSHDFNTLQNNSTPANNPLLQDLLGRTPLEQAKAALSLIGLATLFGWVVRWNRESPPPKKAER